ncbi:hypothetical protein BJ944DRAFT_268519 [Cunninghamella echinulata]|nr:hypothetical protein BJ944DRAFT_268519 [Cunninghamella echinulata]
MDWIQDYFQLPTSHCSKNSNSNNKIVHITNRPPLYLQHSGHSRTVIGIELLKNGKRNLIMFDPGRRMLRSYHHFKQDQQYHGEEEEEVHLNDPTEPEDDIDESNLSSSVNDDEDDEDDEDEVSTPKEDNHHENNGTTNNSNSQQQQGFTSRFFSKFAPQTHLPANLLRPFRVDAKTIAKNKQYQLLVLGEVLDNRMEGDNDDIGGKLVWNEEKGYLLNEDEREQKKNITSIGMTL